MECVFTFTQPVQAELDAVYILLSKVLSFSMFSYTVTLLLWNNHTALSFFVAPKLVQHCSAFTFITEAVTPLLRLYQDSGLGYTFVQSW